MISGMYKRVSAAQHAGRHITAWEISSLDVLSDVRSHTLTHEQSAHFVGAGEKLNDVRILHEPWK